MEIFWELPLSTSSAAAAAATISSSIFAGALDVEAPATPMKDSVHGEEAINNQSGHHFLDACFLCDKPIAGDKPIFMYRGDVPFCSEDCRQAQIDLDEVLGNDRVLLKPSAVSSHHSTTTAVGSGGGAANMKRIPTLFTHAAIVAG